MYENVTALVLAVRRGGESDKRLALFTRELGRLTAVAAGAAKPGAKLAAATESAVESVFRLWREPDATAARVTGGGLECGFPALRTDWRRMTVAQFLGEWTERLTPFLEPHPATYDLLRRALLLLESGDVDAVRITYMARFLALAGYNPARDVSGLPAAATEDLALRSRHDLDAPPPPLPPGVPAPALAQQLLKFVSPLLTSPLRAQAHEEALRAFSNR